MIIKPDYVSNIFKGKKIFTFDSEAFKKNLSDKKEFQYLYLGNIYSDNENYYFYSLQDFLKIVLDLKEKYPKLMFIAHNLKYDLKLIGLLDLFISENQFLGLDIEVKMYGHVNYFKFKDNDNQIEFLDSMNYVKLSLKEIGQKMFNLDKTAHEEYNYSGDKWNNYIREKGRELVLRDCEILYKLMNYLQTFSVIDYGLSAPQSAFKTWNFRFNEKTIIDLDRFNLIAGLIYHGGRTEVYERGKKDNHISLDINSLYPYVMKKYKFSVKFRQRLKINSSNDLELLLDNIKKQKYNYIMLIDFKTNLKRTPVMNSINGSLIDLQENLTWITGLEFLLLHENDKNLTFKIYNCLEFINEDLFSQYIDYFYDIKKNAKNEVEKLFAKLMLNSLYGKFGQKSKHVELENYDSYPELEIHKEDMDRITYNGKVYSLYENFLTYNVEGDYKYCPLIAGEITAFSRCENYMWQIKLGIEHIKMTDTDSFFVPLKIFKTYSQEFLDEILGNELGKLKIEWDKSGNIKFYGLKDYQNYDLKIRKTKGISKNSKLIGKNKYEVPIFILLNKNKEIGIIVEKREKQLLYNKTKCVYNGSQAQIFKNEKEYYEYNKIKIPFLYNDKCMKAQE